MLPTLGERENVVPLIDELLGLGVPGLEVLVVDDESPDGTADAVAALARERPGVRLLRRAPPGGRGLAGRDGYLHALACGASYLVEMDADYSHPPRSVPALLAAMDACDVAVGSRLAPGGSDRDRPGWRRGLTLLGCAWARGLLGLPVADANSGFRCFSRRALEALDPATLRSPGPAVVHETLHRAARAGLRLREVPIDFAERRAGRSKLGPARLLAGWLAVIRLRFS